MPSNDLYTEAHHIFRDTVRRFFEQKVVPFYPDWEDNHAIPRDFWLKAGDGEVLAERSAGKGY